jgi:hypothetical protein
VKVDYPASRLVDDVDDFGDGRRILVTGDDDGTGLDERAWSRASRRKAHTWPVSSSSMRSQVMSTRTMVTSFPAVLFDDTYWPA